MHYQPLLIALFTTSVFAKHAWVASFDAGDCSGESSGDVTNLDDVACTSWNPKYDRVLLNFGSTIYHMDSITAFTDPHCQKPATESLNASDYAGTYGYCTSMSAVGGTWQSFMNTANYRD